MNLGEPGGERINTLFQYCQQSAMYCYFVRDLNYILRMAFTRTISHRTDVFSCLYVPH